MAPDVLRTLRQAGQALLRPFLLDKRHRDRIRLQARLARDLDALDPVPPHVARARDLWALGILDPGQKPVGTSSPEPEIIDGLIRRADAGAWTWIDAYTRNGQRAWCGHFVAACYGTTMPQRTRSRILASTYRLSAYRHEGGVELVHEPRVGDIAVVGYAGGHEYGDHICLVERIDDGLLYTIEGNAKGLVPGGRRGVKADVREGVIRRTRPIGPASRRICPVSGLQQSAGLVALYRWSPP